VNAILHRLRAAAAPSTQALRTPAVNSPPEVQIKHLVVSTKAGFDLAVEDLVIHGGETIAIVGANGAGKTTLLEAMLGLRKAVAADGTVGGLRFKEWMRKHQLSRRMGVMLQRTALPFGLRVRHVMDLHRNLYGRQSDAILGALGIREMENYNYDWLSRGQRQRVDLMMALAHEPEIAILDEPFTGLDQQFSAAAHHLLSGMTGTTILMACHSARELSLADRMLWIRDGRVAALAPPSELIEELLGSKALKVTLADDKSADNLRARAAGMARFIHAPRPDQLNVFGASELETLAHSLIGEASIASVEFGASNFTDLLHICALRGSNA
jgi:ABC-2 type transport system ATP-binding protein